ncbi:hypothetical protein D6D85_14445 [Candidatus Methanodesulfokora washburnensis]|uniref:Uncharacterized protein n=1 Tax=Candidatus Methanodesulfokora washburnensis TaxID=2478471 RepID=A0A429GEJ7_9CREN|nr:hypothetical protein D6D85_14445 [Candidatus Methanodesulfokores washburnensis]
MGAFSLFSTFLSYSKQLLESAHADLYMDQWIHAWGGNMIRVIKTIYLPEDLFHKIENYAKTRNRSFNSTVVELIERGLKLEESGEE